MDEEPEGADVVLQALGEGERLPHEPAAPLAEGTPEPLHVVGQPGLLAGRRVPLLRDDHPVRRQEVGAEDGLLTVLVGQAQPQGTHPANHVLDSSFTFGGGFAPPRVCSCPNRLLRLSRPPLSR